MIENSPRRARLPSLSRLFQPLPSLHDNHTTSLRTRPASSVYRPTRILVLLRKVTSSLGPVSQRSCIDCPFVSFSHRVALDSLCRSSKPPFNTVLRGFHDLQASTSTVLQVICVCCFAHHPPLAFGRSLQGVATTHHPLQAITAQQHLLLPQPSLFSDRIK
jgi:hypothetical protein